MGLFWSHQINSELAWNATTYRFQKSREWDAQFENYQKLFDYINEKPEFNAELKFGTLEDYFTELRKQSAVRITYIDLQPHLFQSVAQTLVHGLKIF